MEFLKQLWAFLRSKYFFYNLGGAVVMIVLFTWLGGFFLRMYTHHGEEVSVPDLRGLNTKQAAQVLENKSMQIFITDSAYIDNKPPLTILDQSPKPNGKVKENRKIYVTVNSVKPPSVKMPDLKDGSLKQAILILESYGLRTGKLIYKPDLAQNAVLDQLWNGRSVKEGTPVPKGSRIDLVLGDGLGTTEIQVPSLVGLSLEEAKFVLDGSSLNLGAIIADNSVVGDTLGAFVYKQIPDPNSEDNMIKMGESVDVFLSAHK